MIQEETQQEDIEALEAIHEFCRNNCGKSFCGGKKTCKECSISYFRPDDVEEKK